MANRNWASGGDIYSMHVSPVMLDLIINIGATGSVSSISAAGSTITSVAHTGTGVYQINLADNYVALLNARGSMIRASGALSGILAVEIQNAPNASVSSLTAPKLTITCLDAAGAAADPVSGSSIQMMIYLQNSSVA